MSPLALGKSLNYFVILQIGEVTFQTLCMPGYFHDFRCLLIFFNFFKSTISKSSYLLLIRSPGPEIIKLFSCTSQLSIKFQLLIKTKTLTNEGVSCFKSLRSGIHHANKCQNSCWHFNIYEQDTFSAQLS